MSGSGDEAGDVAAKAAAFDKIAALLGSHQEWDGAADYLEEIASRINAVARLQGLPSVSDQTPAGLRYWQAQASRLRIS